VSFYRDGPNSMTKMNWGRVRSETRGWAHGYTSIADERRLPDTELSDPRRVRKITPVRVNEAFWREWRKNKARMKAKGYHVEKNIDGQWEAWIEQIVDRTPSTGADSWPDGDSSGPPPWE
jgi:hypothetical protein